MSDSNPKRPSRKLQWLLTSSSSNVRGSGLCSSASPLTVKCVEMVSASLPAKTAFHSGNAAANKRIIKVTIEEYETKPC